MSFQPGSPLPDQVLEEKFLAATGPGGQNVNKVATAVQMRLDVFALRLPPSVYRRLKEAAGSRWTKEGEIVLVARNFRTREANREDARARMQSLVDAAWVAPVRRVPTKVGKAAKARRLEGKSKRSEVKQGRGRVRLD